MAVPKDAAAMAPAAMVRAKIDLIVDFLWKQACRQIMAQGCIFFLANRSRLLRTVCAFIVIAVVGRLICNLEGGSIVKMRAGLDAAGLERIDRNGLSSARAFIIVAGSEGGRAVGRGGNERCGECERLGHIIGIL